MWSRSQNRFENFSEQLLKILRPMAKQDVIAHSKLAHLVIERLQVQEDLQKLMRREMNFTGSAHDGLNLAAERIREQNQLEDRVKELFHEILLEATPLFGEALKQHLTHK